MRFYRLGGIASAVLKMIVVVVRTLILALALVILSSAHGAELVLTATSPAPSDSHDCGCSDGCACKGPTKGCHCSRKGVSLKSACDCGCSGNLHAIGGSAWKSVLNHCCGLRAPVLISRPLFAQPRPQTWRLAFEHTHPPRASL